MAAALAVITASVFGLMVGVELAVAFALNPILLRLPAGPALTARADSGRMLGRVMPVWYVGSLVLVVALAAVTWGTPTASVALVAAGLLTISVIMSVLLLVPINSRSATWTPECHPDDWRGQLRRWDRLHYARVAIIVGALVLAVTAVTTL